MKFFRKLFANPAGYNDALQGYQPSIVCADFDNPPIQGDPELSEETEAFIRGFMRAVFAK